MENNLEFPKHLKFTIYPTIFSGIYKKLNLQYFKNTYTVIWQIIKQGKSI